MPSKVDLGTDEAQLEFWKSLRNHPLLHTKSERVHLGKFQAPVMIASRTIHLFSLKAYFLNAAAITIGMKGTDRRKAPPKPSPTPDDGSGGAVVEYTPTTLKAQSHQTWTEKCTNQLDRAAYLYGDIFNFNRQRLIVNLLSCTTNFHSRRPWELPTHQHHPHCQPTALGGRGDGRDGRSSRQCPVLVEWRVVVSL